MHNLTVAFIFGNSSEYIPRFLDHVKRITPNVVAVRAIGNQAPDDSWELCEAAGCVMGEYKNTEHPDWPHVDNFAAARNLSFSLATTPWVMWLDTDDAILPEAAAMIRTAVSTEKPETMIQLPYRILHHDLLLWRERIVKAGTARWENAVHECLVPVVEPTDESPLRVLRVPAEIIHAPTRTKQGSSERNLRILRASYDAGRRDVSTVYHLFQEYVSNGDLDNATPLIGELFNNPDAGRDEKFEALLMLGAATAEDGEKGRQFFEAAMHIAPERAEAPVELANWHLNLGDAKSALAYARMSKALPLPPAWNARRWAYGWLRDDTLAQALRANGLPVETNKPRISVIHPTCRPIDAIARRRQTLGRAAEPEAVEYIFGINEGDRECAPLKRFLHAVSPAVPEGFSSAVANYNASYRAATCDIIVAAQDDIEFCDGWDVKIIKAMSAVPAGKPAVLHIHDGFRDDKIMVVMCVNRAWADKNPDLLSPEYDGWFSDTEFSIRAYAAGEVIDGRHIKFIHHHPAFTGADSDESYMRQQNPTAFARNKAIFDARNPGVLDTTAPL
jgi:hypothetical protein